jgi:CRP/FNR family transcriptional regulator
MEQEERAAQLRKVPLFEDLSDKEIKKVADSAKQVDHHEGKMIAEEGKEGFAFQFILSGHADVSMRGDVRKSLGPGDYFGEIALIDQGPRTATVTATEPVTTLALSAWTFRAMIDQYPDVAKKLLFGLCKVIRAQGDL